MKGFAIVLVLYFILGSFVPCRRRRSRLTRRKTLERNRESERRKTKQRKRAKCLEVDWARRSARRWWCPKVVKERRDSSKIFWKKKKKNGFNCVIIHETSQRKVQVRVWLFRYDIFTVTIFYKKLIFYTIPTFIISVAV
jgi:hypothetical protein